MKSFEAYFPPLTGFRALAAWLVLIFHYNPCAPEGTFGLASAIINEWHMGVSFFFVLSGFLITWKYYQRISFTSRYLREYFLKRLARIYPLYFILTTITFILYLVEKKSFHGNDGILYFLNLTFLKGFFNDFKFTLIPQAWSLTVEECFYFLAPLIFLLVSKKNFWLFLLPVILFSLGLLLTFVSAELSDLLTLKTYGFFKNNTFMLTFTIFGRSFEFFIGIGLALFLKKKGTELYRRAHLTSLSILMLALFTGVLAFGNLSPALKLLIHQGLIPLSAGVLILGLVKENSIVKSILASKPLELLGKSSYALYLVHIGFIPTWAAAYISDNSFVIALIVVASSYILWRWVEEPLHKYVLKWGRKSN
ncbi:MAG: acyltransferase [Flammeovirgaceae bacterium]|nr:acyltransferase [Flammeovirgaceae bacterium]